MVRASGRAAPPATPPYSVRARARSTGPRACRRGSSSGGACSGNPTRPAPAGRSPADRAGLAARLGLAPNTVARAYRRARGRRVDRGAGTAGDLRGRHDPVGPGPIIAALWPPPRRTTCAARAQLGFSGGGGAEGARREHRSEEQLDRSRDVGDARAERCGSPGGTTDHVHHPIPSRPKPSTPIPTATAATSPGWCTAGSTPANDRARASARPVATAADGDHQGKEMPHVGKPTVGRSARTRPKVGVRRVASLRRRPGYADRLRTHVRGTQPGATSGGDPRRAGRS